MPIRFCILYSNILKHAAHNADTPWKPKQSQKPLIPRKRDRAQTLGKSIRTAYSSNIVLSSSSSSSSLLLERNAHANVDVVLSNILDRRGLTEGLMHLIYDPRVSNNSRTTATASTRVRLFAKRNHTRTGARTDRRTE